jgi:hypothetical protein
MTSIFKQLSCSVNGHQFKTRSIINERVSEVRCCKCGKEMTTNIYGNLVPLNENYSRINHALSELATRRKSIKRVA